MTAPSFTQPSDPSGTDGSRPVERQRVLRGYDVRAILLFSAAAGLALGSSASATELVTNGDFSGGASGFSSTYANGGGGGPAQGNFYISTNPAAVCGCFVPIGDHTSGAGNMLVGDGATSGDYLWSETIAVVPNQTYTLSFWATGVNYGGPTADILATVNGSSILDSGSVPQSNGDTATTWNHYQTSFSSGPSSSLTLSLYDTDTDLFYNDFAVDDVSLTGPAPALGGVPEPGVWTLTILGLFGLGAALRGARRKALAFG